VPRGIGKKHNPSKSTNDLDIYVIFVRQKLLEEEALKRQEEVRRKDALEERKQNRELLIKNFKEALPERRAVAKNQSGNGSARLYWRFQCQRCINGS
jgi:hypothetical protein